MNALRRGLHDVVGACTLDAVLIRIVKNHGHLVAKVVVGRRCGRAPFERRAFPWIVSRSVLAPEPAVDQVVKENQLGKPSEQRRYSDELMNGNQRDEVIVGESLVAAYVAGDSQVVERH